MRNLPVHLLKFEYEPWLVPVILRLVRAVRVDPEILRLLRGQSRELYARAVGGSVASHDVSHGTHARGLRASAGEEWAHRDDRSGRCARSEELPSGRVSAHVGELSGLGGIAQQVRRRMGNGA